MTAYNSGAEHQLGEKITMKVNINDSAVNGNDTSGQTKMGYRSPMLLKVLLATLVKVAGIAPEDITVYDMSHLFQDYTPKAR